ncbi:MAG: transcriptional regulator [Odoribacter sp.]|nr:transcriptional regulator [Odoribacter sp.]
MRDKSIISDLNKVFDNRIRLGIMSVLMVNDQFDFTGLKGILNVTDGNLASHLKALEEKELIRVNKQFVGRKPNTTYKITKQGVALFKMHLKALERLINAQ